MAPPDEPPEVKVQITSKIWKDAMNSMVSATVKLGINKGRVMCLKRWKTEAPSTLAESNRSVGIDWSPARIMIVGNANRVQVWTTTTQRIWVSGFFNHVMYSSIQPNWYNKPFKAPYSPFRTQPQRNPFTIGGSIHGSRTSVLTNALPGNTSVSNNAIPREIINSRGRVNTTTAIVLNVTFQNSDPERSLI